MEAPKRILLVDDEKEFLFSAGLALKRAGYEVHAYANPEEAVGRILGAVGVEDPFDLLVTDIRMPEMSGVELVGELRKRKIAVKVLAITSVCEKNLLRDMNCGSGADHLQKPFGPGDLVERIRRIFTRGISNDLPEDDIDYAEFA
jgi:two-component system OmpR family response regulator